MSDVIEAAVAAARHFGLDPRPTSGFVYATSVDCKVDVDGRTIELNANVGSDSPHLSVRTVTIGANPLHLDVRHGYVYPIGRAIGIQDIRIGHEEFDDVFIVKSNDETLARLWLQAPTRGRMLIARGFRFSVRKGRVEAAYMESPVDGDIVLAAIRAVVGLANRSRELHAEMQELALSVDGTVYGAPERLFSALHIVAEMSGVPARIKPHFAALPHLGRKKIVHTCVSIARRELATDNYFICAAGARRSSRQAQRLGDYVACGADRDAVARRVTDHVREQVAALAPLVVDVAGEKLLLALSGFVTDAERLRAAVALLLSLDRLGDAAGGPYR